MSLNKFADINQEKKWMNLNVNEIKCEALEVAGVPVEGGINAVGWSNGTSYNATISESFTITSLENGVARGNGGTRLSAVLDGGKNYIDILQSGVYEFSGLTQYLPVGNMEGGVLVLQYEDDTGQQTFTQRPRVILTNAGELYQLSVLEINEIVAPARIKLVLQGWVGDTDEVVSIRSFGFSAKYLCELP